MTTSKMTTSKMTIPKITIPKMTLTKMTLSTGYIKNETFLKMSLLNLNKSFFHYGDLSVLLLYLISYFCEIRNVPTSVWDYKCLRSPIANMIVQAFKD